MINKMCVFLYSKEWNYPPNGIKSANKYWNIKLSKDFMSIFEFWRYRSFFYQIHLYLLYSGNASSFVYNGHKIE